MRYNTFFRYIFAVLTALFSILMLWRSATAYHGAYRAGWLGWAVAACALLVGKAKPRAAKGAGILAFLMVLVFFLLRPSYTVADAAAQVLYIMPEGSSVQYVGNVRQTFPRGFLYDAYCFFAGDDQYLYFDPRDGAYTVFAGRDGWKVEQSIWFGGGSDGA